VIRNDYPYCKYELANDPITLTGYGAFVCLKHMNNNLYVKEISGYEKI
jgi:hypothetical protein